MVLGVDVVGVLAGLASSSGVLFGLGAVGLAVAIWRASEAPNGEESIVWPLVALGSAAAIGFVVLSDPGGFIDSAISLWWVPLLALVAYIGFVYVSEQMSGGSATKGTRRRVESTTEEIADAGVGMAIGIVGAASALAIGLMSGVELFGDALAPVAGEAAYLGAVALGYLGLGGSLPGSGLVPSLSPIQYVAMALIIGGLAIAFRE